MKMRNKIEKKKEAKLRKITSLLKKVTNKTSANRENYKSIKFFRKEHTK